MRKFIISGMSCTACSARVEKAAASVPGVVSCSVNLMTNTMNIEGTASDEAITDAVAKAGYGAEKAPESSAVRLSDKSKKETKSRVTELILSVILLIPLMYLGMGHGMLGLPLPGIFGKLAFLNLLCQTFLCAAIMIINKRFFISGFRAVLSLSPNMDTLIALGSSVSFFYSLVLFISAWTKSFAAMPDCYYESAAMVLIFVSAGKMLESAAKSRTTDALESLANLAPSFAVLLTDEGEKRVDASSIRPGDVFAVRPGERFPADGTVLDGISSADESAFTGESIPCEKEPGSKVYTASVNLSGYLVCRADKTGGDTAIASIVRSAADASATKAPISRAADRIAAILVPCVIAISTVTMIIWLIAGRGFSFALERAVSVLVITCPCSLGLATPVAITVAGGIGAKCGILFKNAEALEVLSSVDTVVMDKTGTLTNGKPEVTDIFIADNFDENEILSLVYSLEHKSEHPLGKAVANYCASKNITFYDSDAFTVYPGSGLGAEINGASIRGGSLKYVSEYAEIEEKYIEISKKLSGEGKTLLYFTADGKFICLVAERDGLRENAVQTVASLRKMNVSVAMLTGDNAVTARAIASEAGIENVYPEVLPDGKAAVISSLGKDSHVAMVGDGINDAPALIAADSGIAIAAGADIAVDSADIVLTGSDISGTALCVKLARRTMTVIRENLFWAFIYNIICIPLAAGAFIRPFGITVSPIVCALCMSLSSICVVANSLRLYYIFRKEISDKKETAKMKITLKVEGMMCPHCEARVKGALESLPFVSSAEPSHKKNRVVIELTEEGHDAEIVKCIKDAGYEAV